MATNIVFEQGDQLYVTVTHPTAPTAGSPVRYGDRPGVALTAEQADGKTSVKFDGAASFSVKGINGSGNSPVAEGDTLYYVDGDTPVLSKKATGVRFGYAAGAVATGVTSTIDVIIGY